MNEQKRSLRTDVVEAVASARPLRFSPLVQLLMGSCSEPRGWAVNGQSKRQAMVRSMVRTWEPSHIVELGTYSGLTTEFLWYVTGRPVISIERNKIFARVAKKRFRDLASVRVECDSSTSFLAGDRLGLPDHDVLFYLDSHWKGHIPVREELTLIDQRYRRSVVIVDDIEVLGDPGYGFLDAGEGLVLTSSWVEEFEDRFEIFVPRASSTQESGFRRGCAVLVSPELVDRVVDPVALRPLRSPT